MGDGRRPSQRQVVVRQVDDLADPHAGLGHQDESGLIGPSGGLHDRVELLLPPVVAGAWLRLHELRASDRAGGEHPAGNDEVEPLPDHRQLGVDRLGGHAVAPPPDGKLIDCLRRDRVHEPHAGIAAVSGESGENVAVLDHGLRGPVIGVLPVDVGLHGGGNVERAGLPRHRPRQFGLNRPGLLPRHFVVAGAEARALLLRAFLMVCVPDATLHEDRNAFADPLISAAGTLAVLRGITRHVAPPPRRTTG